MMLMLIMIVTRIMINKESSASTMRVRRNGHDTKNYYHNDNGNNDNNDFTDNEDYNNNNDKK